MPVKQRKTGPLGPALATKPIARTLAVRHSAGTRGSHRVEPDGSTGRRWTVASSGTVRARRRRRGRAARAARKANRV